MNFMIPVSILLDFHNLGIGVLASMSNHFDFAGIF